MTARDGSCRILDQPNPAQNLVLADRCPRRLNQRGLHVKDGALTTGPKRPNWVGEENHGRWLKSIFLEKNRDFQIGPRVRNHIGLSVRQALLKTRHPKL